MHDEDTTDAEALPVIDTSAAVGEVARVVCDERGGDNRVSRSYRGLREAVLSHLSPSFGIR